MLCTLTKLVATTLCRHQWHNTRISRTEEVRRCRECEKLQLRDVLKGPNFRTCSDGEYFKALTKARNFKNFVA